MASERPRGSLTPPSNSIPPLSALEGILAKPYRSTTDPAGSFPTSTGSHFHQFKSQFPNSVDAARRPLPSGRPGSPFSFGDPPAYSRQQNSSPGMFFIIAIASLATCLSYFFLTLLLIITQKVVGLAPSEAVERGQPTINQPNENDQLTPWTSSTTVQLVHLLPRTTHTGWV